ncbi:hypothetical protein HHI36_000209 [Cryptolaemus montrouzieri]|uniref:Uncharacterized protein n=1 Tax=Cryptolaemus montrouzieri TaxID=559131 RepID=A0ABD2P4X2_9CUCU
MRQSKNGASSHTENLVPPTLPFCLFNNGPAIEGQSIPIVSLVPVDEQHEGQQQYDLRDENIDDPTVETSRDQLEEPATTADVPSKFASEPVT